MAETNQSKPYIMLHMSVLERPKHHDIMGEDFLGSRRIREDTVNCC